MQMEKDQRLDASEPHFEVIDTATQEVWQSVHAVDDETFRAMDPGPGMRKIGVGTGAMVLHFFRRSPDADRDGPVRTREIGGHACFHCARPIGAPELPAGPSGPHKMQVDKHHTLIYRAGREIRWLHAPDGSDYVHVIDAGRGDAPLPLPEGFRLSREKLERDLVVALPHPTTAFFFPGGDSYQGPVERGD